MFQADVSGQASWAGAQSREKLIPGRNASRILPKPLLVRDRMATGTRREQWASPPWDPPEGSCDGGFRKVHPGSNPPARCCGLYLGRPARKGGQGTVRSRPAGVRRRVDESRAVNAARGAAEAPNTNRVEVFCQRPAPLLEQPGPDRRAGALARLAGQFAEPRSKCRQTTGRYRSRPTRVLMASVNDIRTAFLDYFAGAGHERVASSPTRAAQ
jgi:hypothetical protein